MDERSEQVREEFMDIATADMGINWSDEHIGYTIKKMADEIVRLRAIFAMLKHPSEKVLLAAVEAVSYGASYAALMHCIPAAVAAAEQEVSA